MEQYRNKYHVWRFLEDQYMLNPNRWWSVKEISAGLNVDTERNFYHGTRHIRNSVIALISERMVETSITHDPKDWRILIRAKKDMIAAIFMQTTKVKA